ncbi:hypothetical protein DL98DRAFT_598971 [Cadophora sp. DSE1049]|nr:hypothetical protein DL98DRAFT_598971 [Cadophora sp. DSE1049]
MSSAPTPTPDPDTLSIPKREELRLKAKYLQAGGSPTSTIVTYHLILRIIQYCYPPSSDTSTSLTYDEARTKANALYIAGAIRFCPQSHILVVEDPEVKEMVGKYEREVPEHVCAEGKDPKECVWPDWDCGTRFEVRDGVCMFAPEGEEMRPVNPDFPN